MTAILTRNGISIEVGDGTLIQILDGDEDSTFSLPDYETVRMFEQFLSEPVPEVDTRKWHYETFDVIEDERNTRWFCRTCQVQNPSSFSVRNCTPRCHKCHNKLTDIFKYRNRIYE
ncbi:hypothetical protein LCGC14_2162000 [marine sediment metagenome]|uniref:Uncharacterized protein n=1 Tax=marine sediment metagenome TaxID=412755 RepID=A0A0F9G578_9ZZZZ